MTLHRSSILLTAVAAAFVAFAACGEPDPVEFVDAGVIADAGSTETDTDAGQTSDAGLQPDAGETTDAGTEPDAGTLPDAGIQPDAGTSGPPCTGIDDIGPACEACVNSAQDSCGEDGAPCQSQYAAVVTCAANAGCTTSPMDWKCASSSCFASIAQFDSCLYSSCPEFKACFP